MALAGGVLLGLSAFAAAWEWLCVYATTDFFRGEGDRQGRDRDEIGAESGSGNRSSHDTRASGVMKSPSQDWGPGGWLDGTRNSGRVAGGSAGVQDLPPAAVLVPLRGSSEGNRKAIRSMLAQDYPQFDVIVGAEESDRDTLAMLRDLQQELPALKVVAGVNTLGGRPKVGNLHNALQASTAPLLAMLDADVVAEPHFLRCLLAPLLSPTVGLTTSLYRASGGGTVWSRVDALWTSTTYLPSALFGRRVIGEGFAFGAAIATRREVLEQIGGFGAIAPRVGDDYQLGRRTSEQGYRVKIVPCVVTEQVESLTLRQMLDRRVRWSRTIRTFQMAGYAGSVVTYGLPFALAAALLAPRNARRWQWLGVVGANRILCAHLNRWLIEPDAPVYELGLVPLRDFLALIVWALGFTRPRRRPQPTVRT